MKGIIFPSSLAVERAVKLSKIPKLQKLVASLRIKMSQCRSRIVPLTGYDLRTQKQSKVVERKPLKALPVP